VSSRSRKVSLADLAVILHHVGMASQDADVGFVDADRTLTELLRDLAPFVRVREDVLESALAHCTFLAEQGKFLDWRGNTYEQLIGRIGKFNTTYNWFDSED
jgi:hypothetical protein